MKETQPSTSAALNMLRAANRNLTRQQFKTLRDQVLAGDPAGAMRGLRKILQQKEGKT